MQTDMWSPQHRNIAPWILWPTLLHNVTGTHDIQCEPKSSVYNPRVSVSAIDMNCVNETVMCQTQLPSAQKVKLPKIYCNIRSAFVLYG